VYSGNADQVVGYHLVGRATQFEQVLKELIALAGWKPKALREGLQPPWQRLKVDRSGLNRCCKYPRNVLSVVAVREQIDNDALRFRDGKPCYDGYFIGRDHGTM
jgi:hypothetical protein